VRKPPHGRIPLVYVTDVIHYYCVWAWLVIVLNIILPHKIVWDAVCINNKKKMQLNVYAIARSAWSGTKPKHVCNYEG
jgi:hypothetical protein